MFFGLLAVLFQIITLLGVFKYSVGVLVFGTSLGYKARPAPPHSSLLEDDLQELDTKDTSCCLFLCGL